MLNFNCDAIFKIFILKLFMLIGVDFRLIMDRIVREWCSKLQFIFYSVSEKPYFCSPKEEMQQRHLVYDIQ